MTVSELMQNLTRAFSLFTPKMAETWTPIYAAALRDYEGPRLAKAYSIVMQEFDAGSRKNYPSVKDFQSALQAHPVIAGAGPTLDFKARGERARSLMADWRAGQGKRGSNGVPEVLRALEFIAQPLANLRAWSENPEPIALTGKQLRLAQQRAISQQRRIEHGSTPKDPGVWWSQIAAIAERWGITTTLADWTKDQPKVEAAE